MAGLLLRFSALFKEKYVSRSGSLLRKGAQDQIINPMRRPLSCQMMSLLYFSGTYSQTKLQFMILPQTICSFSQVLQGLGPQSKFPILQVGNPALILMSYIIFYRCCSPQVKCHKNIRAMILHSFKKEEDWESFCRGSKVVMIRKTYNMSTKVPIYYHWSVFSQCINVTPWINVSRNTWLAWPKNHKSVILI